MRSRLFRENAVRAPHTFRDQHGQSMTEFALILPLFVLLLFAVIQLGIAFNHYITLTDAVRAGARKGTVARNLPDPEAAVEDQVQTAASGLDPGDLDVEVNSTWAPASDVTVTASYPYSISLLGLVVKSGRITSTTTERVER
jgi:Flp pilus assembly protein TadG